MKFYELDYKVHMNNKILNQVLTNSLFEDWGTNSPFGD